MANKANLVLWSVCMTRCLIKLGLRNSSRQRSLVKFRHAGMKPYGVARGELRWPQRGLTG